MTYTIEKGVPLPSHHAKAKDELSTRLSEMVVGDSMIISKGEEKRVRSWFHYHKKKCAMRTQSDGTVRVWMA